MDYFLFFFPIIAVIVMGLYFTYSPDKEKDQKVLEENKYISENDVSISQEYVFCNNSYNKNHSMPAPIHIRFIIDIDNCNIVISSYDGIRETVPFSDVIGCEIISNNEVTGGVGRAVAGGLIAGNTGAIVGASTAKEQIKSYKVVLYVKEITRPKIELELIKDQVQKTDSDYLAAVDFAQNVNATVKAIITYNS